MKFMLMMHAPKGTGDWNINQWSPDDIKAHMGFMKKLNEDLKSEGAFVDGQGLSSPQQARVVRVGDAGAPEVTDGPFAETKEFLAGYWIIDVDTAERAYQIAARASSAPGPGGTPLRIPIEVREVLSGLPL